VKRDERTRFEESWKVLKNLRPYFPALRTSPAEAREHGVDPDWFSETARGLYDADIAFNDDQLSRLIEVLQEQGDLENTLIVITADHGEEFFDHGGTSHGFSLYNELLNVPLVFSLPGALKEGEMVMEPVPSINIAPTILELVGAPPIPDAQGTSMAPFLKGDGELPRGPIFAENHDVPNGSLGGMAMITASMVIEGRYKLIFTMAPPTGIDPPKYQLFDLAEDPHETKNLAQSMPARVASLEKSSDGVVGGESQARRSG
jgi:arylsulfatase A-like enzyme